MFLSTLIRKKDGSPLESHFVLLYDPLGVHPTESEPPKRAGKPMPREIVEKCRKVFLTRFDSANRGLPLLGPS